MLNYLTPLRRIVCCMLLSGVSFLMSAQTTDTDSLQAAQLLAAADSLQGIEQFQSSNEKALEAAVIFENLELWPAYVKVYRTIFYNGYYSKAYEAHAPMLEAGLDKIPASELSQRALMEFYLAFSYDSFGEVKKSMYYYENCVVQFEAEKDTANLAKIYGNLGVGLMQLSDLQQSLEYTKSSIIYSELAEDGLALWNNYQNLGRNYLLLSELKKAKKAYDAAKEMHDPLDGTFDCSSATILAAEENYTAALRSIEKGIANNIKVNGAGSDDLIDLLKLKAKYLIGDGQFEPAVGVLEELLADSTVRQNLRNHAGLLISLAEATIGLGNFDVALLHLQKALHVLLPDFEATSPESFPELDTSILETNLILLFEERGKCFWEKYQKGNKLEDLELAYKNFEIATLQIEKVKHSFVNGGSIGFVGSRSISYYESRVKATLEMRKQKGDLAFNEKALEMVQHANAFVLRGLVNEKNAFQIAGISDADLALRKQLKKTLRKIDMELDDVNIGNADSLKVSRFAAFREHEKLQQKWDFENPKYAALRSNLEVATLKELQDGLDKSSLLIKYFLGEKDLYIFSISQNDFQIDQITLPENFKKTIQQFRRSISDLDFVKDSTTLAEQQYLESAHALFQLLLKKPLQRNSDASRKFTRLTIVADGLLNTIPFQALLMEPAERWTDAAKMVVSKYALNYQYFCKNIIAEDSERLAGDDFVAFGLEFDKHTLDYLHSISKDSIANPAILENLRSGALTKLPFSDEEAMALAEIMDGYFWINTDATKANFLEHSATADIIHLATHSILDNDQPEKSALVFTRPADNAENLLRLNEIYALDLRAKLVVLSACNTAYGSLADSEGLISLARAYNVAGVPSVTATLWSVADEATKKIMELYYAFLQEGLDKDIALQKAQMEYLTNEEISSPAFRLPAYWAAWVSIGEKEAVIKDGVGRWVFGMIGMGMILVFVFWRRNGKLV